MIMLLRKSEVTSHTSHTKDGRQYFVPEYANNRTRQEQPVREYPALPEAVARQCQLPSVPIRLMKGQQIADHRGFGLEHIRQQHGAEIRKAGFKSEEDFVYDVLTNYNAIYEVGGGRFAFVVERQGKPKVHVIEVRQERGKQFLSVVTGYVADNQLPRHFRLKWRKLMKALLKSCGGIGKGFAMKTMAAIWRGIK